jgi:membrane protein DedA with SNARE-associated domain
MENKLINWKLTLARIVVLVAMIGIAIFAYSIRNEVQTLQRYGYIDIFIINVIGSATIILPAPALVIVIAAGGLAALNPFWIGTAAGIGSTIGEMTGYTAGYSGQIFVENAKLYRRLHELADRYGVLTIFVLAILPLPLFDLGGMAAGALRMHPYKFLIATLSGKLIKMWIAAYLGAGAFSWLGQ